MAKKIGIIVQRYGNEINGGAEYHAKLIAEKLSKHLDIEVFTSTALDYITWQHHYSEGQEYINDIKINRFKVEKSRNPEKFGSIQNHIFNEEHLWEDEISWLEEEGPYLPNMLTELDNRENEFDYFIFFSYRYYHSYYGLQRFGKKSLLVPTAEHDQVIYLRIFKNLFNLPAAIVYNSFEEKKIINLVSGNNDVPGDVVGVGSEIPRTFSSESFRKKFNIKGRYFIYIGRLDENKGIPQFLSFYTRFLAESGIDLQVVLIGKSIIEIPQHPQIKYLGFLDNKDKFDALEGADFLIIPSQFESLSMVAIEAWATGKPVVANGKTEVLQGQCRRSNAGLWYTSYEEFKEIILLLDRSTRLRKRLGENGISFFEKNYSWDIIEGKYLKLIANLENEE